MLSAIHGLLTKHAPPLIVIHAVTQKLISPIDMVKAMLTIFLCTRTSFHCTTFCERVLTLNVHKLNMILT